MSRSRIAIASYHLARGRVSKWLVGGYGVPENYVDAVRRAGGRPALLLPGDDSSAEELLEPFDGLLLIGGGDVEPRRYGAAHHSTIYGVEPDRDDLEIRLLKEADRAGVPTLAICRGFQVMNVAFGGTLLRHLPDVPGSIDHGIPSGEAKVSHDVKITSGSRLAGSTGVEVLSCSTHHHQGADRLGEGLVATGWSEDGLVEAIEREHGWMLGVQWHPEDTAAADPEQQALFDAFVTRAERGR